MTPAFIVEFKGPSRMATKRRRNQPSDPAEIARKREEARLARLTPAERKNPANWGPNEVSLLLPSNADVGDEDETRTKVRRVCRFDVFARFVSVAQNETERAEMRRCEAAVRRLQTDIAILHRSTGVGGTAVKTLTPTGAIDFAKTRLKAGERIEDAEFRTGAHSWAILTALCEPPVITGSAVNWRAAVQRVTGERNAMAQSALVKAAAHNLAGAYEDIDRGGRRASA